MENHRTTESPRLERLPRSPTPTHPSMQIISCRFSAANWTLTKGLVLLLLVWVKKQTNKKYRNKQTKPNLQLPSGMKRPHFYSLCILAWIFLWKKTYLWLAHRTSRYMNGQKVNKGVCCGHYSKDVGVFYLQHFFLKYIVMLLQEMLTSKN